MLRRIAVILGACAVAVGAVSAVPATASSQPSKAGDHADFRGAVEIFNCSGALVRWADSRADDSAMMLTNGHCFQTEDKFTRDVLVNQPDARSVTLLGRDGHDRGVVKARRLLYSTSFRTDVGLYTLRRSYAEIRAAFHVKALVIADHPPARDAHISMPSGFSRKDYSCQLNGTAFKLYNNDFRWARSLRLVGSKTCRTIHGTSGSPMLSHSREVVGINNAINFDSGQPGCEFSLCEETRGGVVSVHTHRRYGQQTWWLTTCEGPNRGLNLNVDGCRLPKPVQP